jgi:hypothetical protein
VGAGYGLAGRRATRYLDIGVDRCFPSHPGRRRTPPGSKAGEVRILPDAPSSELTYTEEKLFGLIKSVEWGQTACALSSVNLSIHEYKRWGELDFVIASEGGLYAIEVKGGAVSCQSGIWRYTTREGVVTRNESPFAQVARTFFSLESHLTKPAANLGLTRPVPGGFCVIFAGMRRRDLADLINGPDAAPEIVGAAEDIEDAGCLHRFLDRVSRHWQARGTRGQRWDSSTARAVAQHLRPDFDRAVPLSLRIRQARDERVRFTTEQYELLDFLASSQRLLITGAAGCGKTFIGMEVARREAAAGRRVLVLTGTTTLAEHLQLEGSLPASVSVRSVKDALQDLPRSQSADIVIVDEGQQVTTSAMWDLLEHVAVGGAEGGHWLWLADYARQVGVDSGVDDAVLSLLRMASTHQQLIHNCRNTPQLVAAAEGI